MYSGLNSGLFESSLSFISSILSNTPNVTFYENEEDIANKIKAIDANFNREEFLAWSKDVFVKLQMAWTKRDWEEIRLYETNE